MSSFEGQATELIPAVVRMISGCQDSQTSADVSNVSEFQLPDPAGCAGGACTSSLLKVLYNEHHKNNENLSFVQVLGRMREILQSGGYTQIPQLSSSRMMDLNESFDIVPNNCTGTRRAVLIGINYTGQQGQLSGCHNDVGNIKDYLINAQGFKLENITVLMVRTTPSLNQIVTVTTTTYSNTTSSFFQDDTTNQSPTYDNIIAAFRALATATESGDCAFFHYSGEFCQDDKRQGNMRFTHFFVVFRISFLLIILSLPYKLGHGGRLKDESSEESDGYDETLIPVDYQTAGQIRDDAVFTELVGRMVKGSTLTCLLDCCHSGSVLDLPFTFKANGEEQEMRQNPKIDFGKIQGIAISYVISKLCGNGQVGQVVKMLIGGVGSVGGNNVSLGFLQTIAGMIKCG